MSRLVESPSKRLEKSADLVPESPPTPSTTLLRSQTSPVGNMQFGTPTGQRSTTPGGFPGNSFAYSTMGRSQTQFGGTESPTLQRLSMLQGRIATSENQRVASPKAKQDSPRHQPSQRNFEEKFSTMLLDAEKDRRELADKQDEQIKMLDQKTNEIHLAQQRLQSEFESEEATRKTLNSTFAKNFAIKIEERFLKMEGALSQHKRALAASEEARVMMLHSMESRVSDVSKKVDANHDTVRKQYEVSQNRWLEAEGLLKKVSEFIYKYEHGDTEKDAQLWNKISGELTSLREEMEKERRERETEDEERLRMINDGIAFIKDGKETWLRMFDYKMMPIRCRFEDAEARETKKNQEVDDATGALQESVNNLNKALEEEKRLREEEVTRLNEELAHERAEREHTEEQMSKVLEHAIFKLDTDEGE